MCSSIWPLGDVEESIVEQETYEGPYWIRLIRFLVRFNPDNHLYTAPFDLTQDGIAFSIGMHCA